MNNECGSLITFRDMADEGCVKARKDTLNMMLNHRPIVHENVVVVSTIGEQVHELHCLSLYTTNNLLNILVKVDSEVWSFVAFCSSSSFI